MATLKTNCPHCHVQHVAFDVVFSLSPSTLPPFSFACLATCGACGYPVTLIAARINPNGDSIPHLMNADIRSKFIAGVIWPEIAEPAAPAHTPGMIAKRFLEAEDAFQRGNLNSAAGMYRSALDIATKAMVPETANISMYARLLWMRDNHKITPDLWEWADHVRLGGNEALHDPEDVSDAEAASLRFFTEMFLRYVYELPGEVARLREEAETKTES